MSLKKYSKYLFLLAVVVVLVGLSFLYAWAVQPLAGEGSGAIGVDTATNNVSFGTSTALSSSIVTIRSSSTIGDAFTILNSTGGTVLRFSNGDLAVGGSGIDANYSLTTSNGGVKAESTVSGNPAGYFNNTASGIALMTGNGNVGVGKSPSYKLDVNGTTNATQYCISGANCITAWPTSGGQWATSGVNIYSTNSGNVGIGETAPATKLHVTGAIGATDWVGAGCEGACESGGGYAIMYANGNIVGTGNLDAKIYIPRYSNWGTTGDGGAAIVNDNGTYKKLMIVGNNSGGAAREVGIWDNLNVYGNITVNGGSGKLNVGTIDPIYDINGEKYATYVSGMTGQKEETSGVLELTCGGSDCSKTIDFANAEKGSDLWLFAKATDLKDNLSKTAVYLTLSVKGQVWYEKDAANMKLVVHASPEHAGDVEVSYRLTAPRFDSAMWTNIADPSSSGLKVK